MPSKQVQDINRIIFMGMPITELKRIAKDLDKDGNRRYKKNPLLNVDQYTRADKHILVERMVKGAQLEDESKETLFKKS